VRSRDAKGVKSFWTLILVYMGFCGAIAGLLSFHAASRPSFQAARIEGPVEPQVLAFYYPWYYPSSFWPDNCAYIPELSNYDSGNQTVIYTHFKWMKEASITGIISSWWGRGDFTDTNFAKLLNISDQYPECRMNLTIYYETYGRPEEAIKADLAYIVELYGSDPSFLKINGTPVIFVYIPGTVPASSWANIFRFLDESDLHAFFIGDTSDPSYFWLFSGSHMYNPLQYLRQNLDLGALYRSNERLANNYKMLYCTTVLAGYDDRKIRSPGTLLPRNGAETYNRTWNAALGSGCDWILITSFNEWWEGTQIEPSLAYGSYYLNLTRDHATTFLNT